MLPNNFKYPFIIQIMENEIIAIFKKEEDIKKITDRLKNYSFDNLKKHPHFEFSIMEKLTDLAKIKETFSKFELVKTIELRRNKLNQEHYSLNYELEDGTFVVLSVFFEADKPVILNGFHAQTSYKRFEKSLSKNYASKFR